MFNAVSNALSGLAASSQRVNVAASNIANISTSGALSQENGAQPYETRLSTQTALSGGGVASEISNKNPGFVPSYAPDSPFSNSEGLIGVPNTNLSEEIVNLKLAETTYKANVKTLEVALELSEELLSIFDSKI